MAESLAIEEDAKETCVRSAAGIANRFIMPAVKRVKIEDVEITFREKIDLNSDSDLGAKEYQLYEAVVSLGLTRIFCYRHICVILCD